MSMMSFISDPGYYNCDPKDNIPIQIHKNFLFSPTP